MPLRRQAAASLDGPCGVFVVGGVGLEAAVQDADESVGELSQRGVVVFAAAAELVVVGASCR
jgi:hypothetical protein